ncbi:MAG: DUF393 domain-containing protein [Parachlamydiaceae bacterium]|nr:DUF393 domain-containing protein [Parachlamydiaceae bacterium]
MEQNKSPHLVLYDDTCGFCDRSVQFLLKEDHKHQFVFAPLRGETASKVLKNQNNEIKQVDSLILVENYQSNEPQIYILSKSVLRILWLLGSYWILLGWLSFLPSFLFDWSYRLFAKHRHRFFSNDVCVIPRPEDKERFLP